MTKPVKPLQYICIVLRESNVLIVSGYHETHLQNDPGLLWNRADRLHRELPVGMVDGAGAIVPCMERNVNSPQLVANLYFPYSKADFR